MMVAVMLECRAGIRRMVGDCTWEDVYHDVTFTVEDSHEVAQRTIRDFHLYPHENPREVRRVWAEERP